MMRALLIARRELGASLRTFQGYLIIALVLAVDGLLFNAYALGGVSKRSSEVVSLFFLFSSGTTMVASVFISMRLLAEERQTGTLSLLYSSPVKDHEIVLGKFLGAFAFLALLTLATVFMPLLVRVHGRLSLGHIAAGYLGLLLLGGASLAIGTLGSALARNQVLAAVFSGCMLVALLTCWWLARITEQPLSDVFGALALWNQHFQPFQVGVVHVRDVVYYLLVTYVFLFAATRVLEARRWR
ncbi:ABC transporter permease [Melittangium boletus]|nr:ABC transporter permease [Melittangium boletus]